MQHNMQQLYLLVDVNGTLSTVFRDMRYNLVSARTGVIYSIFWSRKGGLNPLPMTERLFRLSNSRSIFWEFITIYFIYYWLCICEFWSRVSDETLNWHIYVTILLVLQPASTSWILENCFSTVALAILNKVFLFWDKLLICEFWIKFYLY